MAGEESGDAMSFVSQWIAGSYNSDLSTSSMYNDLHNLFRSKCGRNALGLRNALQHYVKLGDIEASKGSGYSQMYTIAGAAPEPVQEVHSLPTDDRDNRNDRDATGQTDSVLIPTPQNSAASGPSTVPSKPKAKRATLPRSNHLVRVNSLELAKEKKVKGTKEQEPKEKRDKLVKVEKEKRPAGVQDVVIQQMPKIPKLPRPDGQPPSPDSPPQQAGNDPPMRGLSRAKSDTVLSQRPQRKTQANKEVLASTSSQDTTDSLDSKKSPKPAKSPKQAKQKLKKTANTNNDDSNPIIKQTENEDVHQNVQQHLQYQLQQQLHSLQYQQQQYQQLQPLHDSEVQLHMQQLQQIQLQQMNQFPHVHQLPPMFPPSQSLPSLFSQQPQPFMQPMHSFPQPSQPLAFLQATNPFDPSQQIHTISQPFSIQPNAPFVLSQSPHLQSTNGFSLPASNTSFPIENVSNTTGLDSSVSPPSSVQPIFVDSSNDYTADGNVKRKREDGNKTEIKGEEVNGIKKEKRGQRKKKEETNEIGENSEKKTNKKSEQENKSEVAGKATKKGSRKKATEQSIPEKNVDVKEEKQTTEDTKKSPKKRTKKSTSEDDNATEKEKKGKGKKSKSEEVQEEEVVSSTGKKRKDKGKEVGEATKSPKKRKKKTEDNEEDNDADYDDKKKPKPKKKSEPKQKAPEKTKFLWAKIKSYPWWPARAVKLDSLKEKPIYETLIKSKEEDPACSSANLVQFFGTNDYAWVPRNCIKRDFVKEYRTFSRNIPPENAPELEPAIEEATDEYVAVHGSFPTLTDVDDECCQVCKSPDNADKMLLCDRCDAGYHIYCLAPPIAPEDIPETNWYCDDCIKSEMDIDARSLVTSTIIEPGVVGLVNLGSTCYINSSVQCLNSFANFRDALLQNVNTAALAIPAITPYGTTSRTRAKTVPERAPGADDEEKDDTDGEGEKEKEKNEKDNGKRRGKGKNKSKGKKGKGKAKDEDSAEDNPKEVSEEVKGKSTTTMETTTQVAARVHDYVATFKAVLYSIWHSARGVDRAVLHSLRLASGYALDFKYFRNQHQDINEYLMHALEYLHTYDHRLLTSSSSSGTPEDENKVEKESSPETSQTDAPVDKDQTITEATQRWEQHFKANKSIITDSFEGMIAHTRTCPKGHSSTSFEIFRILTLQFPMKRPSARRGNDKLLLADILDNFTQEEKLQCRCSKCGGTDNKSFLQKTSIFRFPSYLIIQLGRFSSIVQGSGDEAQWWSNKICTDVVFPVTGLDMRGRFPNSYAKDPPPVYDLVAVANHRGGVNGGHYYTYAKSKGGGWFRYDDNLVKEIKDVQLVSEFAYMLFYERRKT